MPLRHSVWDELLRWEGCGASHSGPVRQDVTLAAWTVDENLLTFTWSAELPVILDAVLVCEVRKDVKIIIIVKGSELMQGDLNKTWNIVLKVWRKTCNISNNEKDKDNTAELT